jgi:hypothetical protein
MGFLSLNPTKWVCIFLNFLRFSTQFTRISKPANTIEVILLRGGPWKDPALCNVAPGHGRRCGEAKFRRATGRGRPGTSGRGTLGPRGPIPGLGCGGGGVGEVGRRRPGPVAAAAGIPVGWRLCGSRGAVGELG